jgi:hypothetical protein
MPAGGSQNSKQTLEFLGELGTTDRGDKVPLSHSANALVQLGEFLIKTATKNLQKKGHTATGETASSMRIVNLDIRTIKMSLDIEILDTYKFLDQGVKGTESGAGKYSFKTSHPNKKMATAILKWARKRSLSGKTKYKPKGVNEAKDVKMNKMVTGSDNLKGMAYAISTNIKKFGIEKTLFFSDAVKDTKALQKKKYADAFKLDIIENLS